MSSRSILKKVQGVVQNARDGDVYDIDQLEAKLVDIDDLEDGDNGADDGGREGAINIADSIRKALALVTVFFT